VAWSYRDDLERKDMKGRRRKKSEQLTREEGLSAVLADWEKSSLKSYELI